MDRIQELRALLASNEITLEELAELKALIAEQATNLRAESLNDEVLAQLNELADTLTEAKAKENEIKTAQAEQRAAADEALARIEAAMADDDASDDDGGDDGEPVTTAELEDAEEPQAEREPVAAAARPVVPEPTRVSRVAARRPERVAPKPMVEKPKMSLVASANVPGFTAGTPLDDPEKFAQAFANALTAAVGHKGPVTNMPIATTSVEYPDDQKLDGDLRRNLAKIGARTSLSAITASGGACAPSTVMYDLPVLGTAERPVRDQAMVRFGADRGGVRVMPPPHIWDLDQAVNTWSAATDASPGGNTKNCLTVTCPSPTEVLVDAIVRCLKFGNFQARFFAEQTDAWLNLAATRWAREAEEKLLTSMGSGSTAVTTTQGLGTTRDVLAAVGRAAAGMRSRHRLPRNYPLRLVFPDWLYDNIRVDLARELPGAASERLAVAEAEIDTFFRVLNINLTSVLDGETGQEFGQQAAGGLAPWPSNVIMYLYPEGSWLFLDGGQLDLGIVRDSTLNAKNDFQMFAESFEQTVFHGVESLRLNIDICPSGKTSAAATFDPCTLGS